MGRLAGCSAACVLGGVRRGDRAGQDYRETFQVFRPGFDLDKARQQRADEGKPEWFGDEDLYPDVRPALARLRDDGPVGRHCR